MFPDARKENLLLEHLLLEQRVIELEHTPC
jgi:hypothetical protein